MIRLHLVRHGQAAFDSDDYDQLSPLGLQQATSLGAWWRVQGAPVHAVWHGGMRRHLQTLQGWQAALQATPMAEGALPPAMQHAGLREFDHREIFFAERPDLRDPAALQAWKAAPGDYGQRFARTYAAAQARWLGGAHAADYQESWAEVRARVIAALVQIAGALHPRAAQRGAAEALVFTSAGPISALLQHVQVLPDAQVPDLQAGLHNTGVTELLIDPQDLQAGWRVGARDHTAHLASSGVAASRR